MEKVRPVAGRFGKSPVCVAVIVHSHAAHSSWEMTRLTSV